MRVSLGVVLVLVGVVRVGLAQVTLAWEPPTIGTTMGYVVYRQVPQAQFEMVGTAPLTDRRFTDVSPALGTNTYHVTAWNTAGESLPSPAVTVVCVKYRGKARLCTVP